MVLAVFQTKQPAVECVSTLLLVFWLDLFDEPSKFAIDCSGVFVVDRSDPAPM